MKRILSLPWVSCLSSFTLLAADAPDPQVVQSKIIDVTVYADRARVMRQAGVPLAAGSAQYVFEKLPGWVDEGSVRVELSPPNAGRILDVQVRRTYLAKATDEEFRQAETAVRDISDQIAVLDDEKAVLEAQAKHVESIRMFSLEKLPKDVVAREVKPEEYAQSVDFIVESLRKIATAKRELEKKRRELQPELTVRQKRLEELRKRSQLEESTVVVSLEAPVAMPGTLKLAYMLPGATWEPVHELRASPDAGTVTLASSAVVMQTTGEDWSDVMLSLSTQRTTETLQIPELEALLVGTGRRLARVQTSRIDSFKVAAKSYADQNVFWNEVVNPDAAGQQEFRRNRSLLLDNTKRVERLFQTLQDRGTTEHYPALTRQTIRSDGRPVRVPIGTAELAATHRIMAAPELSLNAIRTVDLANTTEQAVLPGKVALYLGGAFLGMTEAEFVAPGESFSLYLGVAEEIKLTRLLDKKRSELKRGGRRTKMQATFVVTVENLSDQPASLELTDRVPVSEMEEVRVSGVRIRPEGKPDDQGLLRWKLTLAAKEKREFQIEYSLEYPNELPQLKVQQGPEQTNRQAVPPGVMQQIITLERNF